MHRTLRVCSGLLPVDSSIHRGADNSSMIFNVIEERYTGRRATKAATVVCKVCPRVPLTQLTNTDTLDSSCNKLRVQHSRSVEQTVPRFPG